MEFELEPGEQVRRTVRKHWIVFAGVLLPYAFLALVPLALPAVLRALAHASPAFASMVPHISLAAPLARLVLGMWWFALWIGAFNAFAQYFLNLWVITTHRIVEIKQYGFFNRKVSSFLLEHVQDVTTSVDGFIADLFGYGCMQVETAGNASQHFTMDGVENPQGMRDLIMREIALLHGQNKGA